MKDEDKTGQGGGGRIDGVKGGERKQIEIRVTRGWRGGEEMSRERLM